MKKIFAILLALMILLTGCGNSKTSEEDESEQSTKVADTSSSQNGNENSTDVTASAYPTFPENYESEDGNVKFDCAITGSTNLNSSTLYTAKANQCEINVDNAFEELFSQVTDYETYEYEGKNEYGETVKTSSYVSNNETIFSYGPMSSALSYSTADRMPYIDAAFRLDEEYDDYNADLYSTGHQLDFASSEEIYADLMELFEKIGAPTGYAYKAYALDHDTMESQEFHQDMNGDIDTPSYKTEWTSADDSYYFVMRQCFEEIPVYHVFQGVWPLESDANTPVQVIVSADGIEYLMIEKTFTFSDKKAVTDILPFDEVAATVANKYNQVLGAESYEITSAELYYYVDLLSGTGTYDVYPCWILKGSELQDNSSKKIQIIIDAQTGEEIVPCVE